MAASPATPTKALLAAGWQEAAHRVLTLEDAERSLYSLLVRHMEHAADYLSRLQLLFEGAEPTTGGDRRLPHLLQFIDEDISDVFRSIAISAAWLIPGPGWLDHADPPEVQAEARLLARYLSVAAAAAEHPEVPREVRNAFRAAAEGLKGWDEELVHLVDGIATAVLEAPKICVNAAAEGEVRRTGPPSLSWLPRASVPLP